MTEDDSQVKSRSALTIGFYIVSAAAVSLAITGFDLKGFARWFLSANPFWFWPLYFLALALVFFVLYPVYRLNPKRIQEPLKIPHAIDPYSIAYLRGGNKEVISTAMIELVAAGKIVEYVPPPKQIQRSIFNKIIASPINNSKRSERSTDHWIAKCDDASSDSTPKIHQIILKHFFAPKGAMSVFHNDDVYSAVGSLMEPYEEWIKTEGLRNTQYREFDSFLVLAYGSFLGFEALGFSKAQIDFPTVTSKPEWHTAFPVIVMLIPMVFIFLLASRPSSTRGQQYLKDVERAFAYLKNDPNTSVGTLAGLFGPSSVTLESVKRIVAQWESYANADGSPAAG
jgi:hypothetical protein